VLEAAYIAELESENYLPRNHEMKKKVIDLNDNHLPEVVSLYQLVFKSFASQAYMEEKLAVKRGRAVGLFMDHQLVAVAQSDYEDKGKAVVVGVATHPDYQGMGYGRACLEALVDQLLSAQMTLYLQYDSPTAGKLYESMGFKPFDRVYYVINDIIGDDL
jgi:predicted GNAT family acetyltransferase